MTLPYVKNTVRDGQSGALALGSELHVKIGVASQGDHNELVIYTDPDTLATDYGVGPLVSAAAYHIATSGTPVAIIRIDPAQVTAGTLGPITKVGGHAGPTISDSSSAPLDSYELLVEIVLGGAVATATFRYSLDNGDTWSAAILTAATVALTGTGITLAFAAGTYVAGHQYSAQSVGPSYNITGLTTALGVAVVNVNPFRLIHAVGYGADATATASIIASVQSTIETASTTNHRYTRVVIEAADDVDADQITAVASTDAKRVALVAGFAELVNPFTGGFWRRPAAWVFVSRVMSVRISRDPGAVADGALPGVLTIERDEFKTPALDIARINTLRTWVGRFGFFVTRGRLLAQIGSDFTNLTNGFVMDAACAVAYDALLNFVNSDVVVQAANGRISEQEAQSIEAFVTAKLREAISDPGDASDVDFVIDRTSNVLTTELLRGKTRILPLGYLRFIENELSFRNPAAELTEA